MIHRNNTNTARCAVAQILEAARFAYAPRFRRSSLSAGVSALALAAVLTIAPRSARADDSIFTDTFETDANTWMGYGPHARVGTTNEAGKVKNGKSALSFNYRLENGGAAVEAGQLPLDALVRPIPDGQLAKARALSFWARTDANTPLAVTLTEKNGGGRYVAVIWLPKNQWHQVVLATTDFALTDGKDDPKDPDGKLDMDQIESVTLLNLYAYAALSVKDTPGNAALFPFVTGEHSLWIDDFAALTTLPAPDKPEPTLPDEKSGLWLESLRRDTLTWLPLGNVEMQVDAKAPTKGRALRLDYTQEKGKFAALIHDMHNVNLTPYNQLQFDVASTKATKLIFVLEEKNGVKYSAFVDVPADSAVARKALFFANFTLTDDSPPDPKGKLDFSQLKNLTIADTAAFTAEQSQQNTLWIGPIRASQSK